MATGRLGFLGRGRSKWVAQVGGPHILGAVGGGGATGALLGGLGMLLALPPWRPWVIGGVAVLAGCLAVRRQTVPLGRHRQVPRTWGQTMPPVRRYFLWGALLGNGLTTLIPYSSFLVLLSAELTAGVATGALVGAIFGGTREAMVLFPLLRGFGPVETMDLLLKCRRQAARLNTWVALVGGILLILTGWQ